MTASIPESTLDKFTTFGDLLKFLRRRVGITQLELSIAVGYSDAQISRLEQNLRLPDIPTIQSRFVSPLDLEHEPEAVTRLLDLAAHVRREDAPGHGICPYKGLSYFDEEDADLYVGREALVEKLTERIHSLASKEMPAKVRFLAIVGASGSGKSSLVRAGIIPALRWNKRSSSWAIHVLTPSTHPLESLAASLSEEELSVAQTAILMDDLGRDRRSLHLFARRKLGAGGGKGFLLVVDQFEEVFALCRSEEERGAFISNLLNAAAESGGPVFVLIAIRADFYASCANYPLLRAALANNQEYIGAMSDEELRRAIEEPARRGRWEFEDGLVDLLLREVGHEPGALPLLSHALMETWQRRRGHTLTLSGYTSSGGVRGAIAETAESVFTDRFSRQDKELARRIFLRLTELGDETATGDTRRRASFDELIPKTEEANSIRDVLSVLADARLIITSETAAEVCHEALIREWPRLRGWLEDNREGLRLHRRLTEAAQEWVELRGEPELLYRGARLIQAQEWALAHQEEMNPLEREFVNESILSSEREATERELRHKRELDAARKLAELEKQRAEQQARFSGQMRKRALYLSGALLITMLMTFLAVYFASQARRTAIEAQNERHVATSRELAAAALNNIPVDPERSILLALESISTTQSTDGSVLPESLEALHRSIVSSPIRVTLKGHNSRVLSAEYSPDGNQLATIGDDGTVILWDAVEGKQFIRLPGTTVSSDFISSHRLVFSPDGGQIAACDGSQVKLYDPVTGALLRTLSEHQAELTAIAFSPDGKTIASGGFDGAVMIWDAEAVQPPLILAGHLNAIEGLTFSPDSRWLVSAGADYALKIWDAITGEIVQDYPDFSSEVSGVAFSPNGKQLIFSDGSIHVWELESALPDDPNSLQFQERFTIPGAVSDRFSPDGSQFVGASGAQIKVWDAASGRELHTLTGHQDWVMGLAYSPDGGQLVSTSLDGTTKIWDLGVGNEGVTMMGSDTLYGKRVAYQTNGGELITNGGDGSTTLWDATTGRARLSVKDSDQEILNVAFSSDGKRFAAGGFDATVIVRDATSGDKLVTLSGHEAPVRDIAFSPDGSLIATASFDGTARTWNAANGQPHLTLKGHEGLVLAVAFNPEGTRLATGSTDATAKIWDAQTGELRLTLSGHSLGIRDVAYSPEGAILATASGDGSVILWDAANGTQIRSLTGHTAGIQSIAFSPDGKWLASGSEDNTAKIWDVATGAETSTLPGSQGGVTGVAFSPLDQGAHLAVASPDGIVRIFLLKIDELLRLARARVTRSLTKDECKRYLHIDECPVTSEAVSQ